MNWIELVAWRMRWLLSHLPYTEAKREQIIADEIKAFAEPKVDEPSEKLSALRAEAQKEWLT